MKSVSVFLFFISWTNVRKLSVADGNGGTDYTNFTLAVVNTNNLPMILTTALPEGTAGQVYNYGLIASDVDGDTLVWSTGETNASWLSLNSSTGNLQGTPSGFGTFWVNVSVSDGKGGTDNANLTIRILPDLDGIPVPDEKDEESDDESSILILLLTLLLLISFFMLVSLLFFTFTKHKNKR